MSDVPASLELYLQAWNERDTSRIAGLLARSLTEDALFVDPANHRRGRDEIGKMIIEARTGSLVNADYALASGVDSHHDRHRYRWEVRVVGDLLMVGMDVTTLDGAGSIERIDGFFGDIPEA